MSAVLETGLDATRRADAVANDILDMQRDEALMQAMHPQLVADEAEERVLADMDSYSNWLAIQCSNVAASHTRIKYVPRSALNLRDFVDALDVPQLLALTLYPRGDAQALACDALRARYLATCGEYLARVEGELL